MEAPWSEESRSQSNKEGCCYSLDGEKQQEQTRSVAVPTPRSSPRRKASWPERAALIRSPSLLNFCNSRPSCSFFHRFSHISSSSLFSLASLSMVWWTSLLLLLLGCWWTTLRPSSSSCRNLPRVKKKNEISLHEGILIPFHHSSLLSRQCPHTKPPSLPVTFFLQVLHYKVQPFYCSGMHAGGSRWNFPTWTESPHKQAFMLKGKGGPTVSGNS